MGFELFWQRFQSISYQNDTRLLNFALRYRLQALYVDVDKTLLYKISTKKVTKIHQVSALGHQLIDLPSDIHRKYSFMGQAGGDGVQEVTYNESTALFKDNYQVILNHHLINQLKTVQNFSEKGYTPPQINILSTGGWIKEIFQNYFTEDHQLNFNSFENSTDVMRGLCCPIGLFAKGRYAPPGRWAQNSLLIDDQKHQRLSFSARWHGYSLNPGEWWKQPAAKL